MRSLGHISPPAVIYTHYASDLDKLVPIPHLHNEECTRQPRRNISLTQGNIVDLAFHAWGGSGQSTTPASAAGESE